MTTKIFTVYSFTELYNKLKELYTKDGITAQQLLHNINYLDLSTSSAVYEYCGTIINLLKRYKKINDKDLTSIEFYKTKTWRFMLRINFTKYGTGGEWDEKSLYASMSTMGYYGCMKKLDNKYFEEDRNKFSATDCSTEKYMCFLKWNDGIIINNYVNDRLKRQLELLEKLKEEGLLNDNKIHIKHYIYIT